MERNCMQKTIAAAHPMLRQHLHLDDAFLIDLSAAIAIDNEVHHNHEGFTNVMDVTGSIGRIDTLISIIRNKPMVFYNNFLNVL